MLDLRIDYRIGSAPRYFLADSEEGLMLVPDEVRKSVAFVCFNSNKGMKLAGTTFFVAIPMKEFEYPFVYLVTAKHVIEGIRRESTNQTVYIRLNIRDKGAELVGTPIDKWIFHPEDLSVDVAVLGWAPRSDIVDYLNIPLEMVATDKIIKTERIGIGDEVFMTGLFTSHFGQKKNLPIVRIGNIALMPEEPVWTNKVGFIDAYLIEARSIGGLSGSPVFVHTGGIRGGIITGSKFYLLGLMHGHWDLPVSETDALTEDALSSQRINMGIAIVVPTSKILEVINQEKLMAERAKTEEEVRREKAPTPDVNDCKKS